MKKKCAFGCVVVILSFLSLGTAHGQAILENGVNQALLYSDAYTQYAFRTWVPAGQRLRVRTYSGAGAVDLYVRYNAEPLDKERVCKKGG